MASSSSTHVTEVELAEAGLATDVAYDISNTCMATTSMTGLHVYKNVQNRWDLAATLQDESMPECCTVDWAHPEFGSVLAAGCRSAGASGGSVFIWEEEHPGKIADALRPAAGWVLRAAFRECESPVLQVAFAPSHKGLRVAAVEAEGLVRTYECLSVLDATEWELQSCFAVEGNALPHSLAWMPEEEGPLVMALGCSGPDGLSSEHAGVQVWGYLEPCASWRLACTVSVHEGVTALSWSPIAINGVRMLAGASNTTVIIWQVTMICSEDGAQFDIAVQELAQISHASAVCQTEWNMTGSTLATSTVNQSVALWSANLGTGEWQMQTEVTGQEECA